MKRLATREIVLPNVKLRVAAILKSILGLGFIILIYICISGIHINDFDIKDTYIAPIFGLDFAVDRIIQPNIVMHTLRNYNTDTFSDSIDNLSAWYQRCEAKKLIKNRQFTFKKIVLEDEYKTGKLFFIMNIHFVPRVIANNTFDSTAQTDINYMMLENSLSEFKVYGRDCKSWNHNFIKQGSK